MKNQRRVQIIDISFAPVAVEPTFRPPALSPVLVPVRCAVAVGPVANNVMSVSDLSGRRMMWLPGSTIHLNFARLESWRRALYCRDPKNHVAYSQGTFIHLA